MVRIHHDPKLKLQKLSRCFSVFSQETLFKPLGESRSNCVVGNSFFRMVAMAEMDVRANVILEPIVVLVMMVTKRDKSSGNLLAEVAL